MFLFLPQMVWRWLVFLEVPSFFWFAPVVTATVAAANSVAKWHPFAPVLLFFLLDEAGV